MGRNSASVIFVLLLLGQAVPAGTNLTCEQLVAPSEATRFVGGGERLESLMLLDLEAETRRVLRQDLEIFRNSQRTQFTNTIFLQFTGNAILNREIKDSLLPVFLSAEIIEHTFRLFQRRPELGSLVHYNFRDLAVYTNMPIAVFSELFLNEVITAVGAKFAAGGNAAGSVLSAPWIKSHFRMGEGRNIMAAYLHMKIGTRDLAEVHREAFELRRKILARVTPKGVSLPELTRFLRYDLPSADRVREWLKRFHLPETLKDELAKLRDAYFLYDFLPPLQIASEVIARADRLAKSNQTAKAIALLRAHASATWRLQMYDALLNLAGRADFTVMDTDQRKLGLANFTSVDGLLAQAFPPTDLGALDIPNPKGLYRHHQWLKEQTELILGQPDSVRYWLFGDDAGWVLPAVSGDQRRLLTQFLEENSSLHFKLSFAEGNPLPRVRAATIAANRKAMLNHKDEPEEFSGWPVGKPIQIDSDGARYSVKGLPAQKLQRVWGNQNNGIFTYEVNGVPRLVKVLNLDDAKKLVADLPRGSVSESEMRLGMLNREYAGAMAGARLGGPRIYGVGMVDLPHRGPEFYIEMENLFAGQPAKVLKTLIQSGNGDLESVVPYLPEMARMIVRAYEEDVVPYDPDFIFQAGKIRWIDTGRWVSQRRTSTSRIPEPSVSPAARIHIRLTEGSNDPAVAEKFKQSFIEAVKSSKLNRESRQTLLAPFLQAPQPQ